MEVLINTRFPSLEDILTGERPYSIPIKFNTGAIVSFYMYVPICILVKLSMCINFRPFFISPLPNVRHKPSLNMHTQAHTRYFRTGHIKPVHQLSNIARDLHLGLDKSSLFESEWRELDGGQEIGVLNRQSVYIFKEYVLLLLEGRKTPKEMNSHTKFHYKYVFTRT